MSGGEKKKKKGWRMLITNLQLALAFLLMCVLNSTGGSGTSKQERGEQDGGDRENSNPDNPTALSPILSSLQNQSVPADNGVMSVRNGAIQLLFFSIQML